MPSKWIHLLKSHPLYCAETIPFVRYNVSWPGLSVCWSFGSSVAPSSHSLVFDSETNLVMHC